MKYPGRSWFESATREQLEAARPYVKDWPEAGQIGFDSAYGAVPKTVAPPARPAAAAAPPAPVRAIPHGLPTHTQGRGLMNALKVLKTRSGGY